MPPQAMFVTLFYGVLDRVNHTLTYANAGRPAPLVFRTHDCLCSELISSGVALGAMEGMEYEAHELRFCAGDIVVFYTGGVTEALNSQSELYGLERLSNVVSASCHLTSSEILDRILEDISNFSGNQEQYDDITLIVVKAENTTRGISSPKESQTDISQAAESA